jgi:hypothetical protein
MLNKHNILSTMMLAMCMMTIIPFHGLIQSQEWLGARWKEWND